jgi:Flp pilus assembly protein TadB
VSSAEQLLNEAHYAFANISFGESADNRRNRSRASSLCRKILRKYPGTTEAREAHAILLRLGDETYSSNLAIQHRHVPPAVHHQPLAKPKASPVSARPQPRPQAGPAETLDWGGLFSLVLTAPKAILVGVALAVFVLFSIFGPFLLLGLVALLLFTTPFRATLKSQQRQQMDEFVRQVNAYIRERRGLR